MDETATAVPRDAVSCTIQARSHEMVQDKPAASGGHDDGPMASEFLLAALLSCQLSTFAKVAAKRKQDVTVESIRGDLHFNDAGDIGSITITWSLNGEPGPVPRLTDRACTISKVLDVPTEIRVA